MREERRCDIPLLTYEIFGRESRLMTGVTMRKTLSGEEFSLASSQLTTNSQEEATRNRQRLCRAVGVSEQQYFANSQVHGTTIRRIDSLSDSAEIVEGDGMMTQERGVLLNIFSADCLLLTLYDPVNHAVALAHAGWRGVVGEIACRVVESLQREYRSNPEDLLVGISPSIGECCFQVGYEVRQEFFSYLPLTNEESERGEFCVDLKKVVKAQLNSVGVSQIESSETCTGCSFDKFFSHRRENGKTGRFSAFALLS